VEPAPAHPRSSIPGIAAAFLVGAAAGLGVLGAWKGAVRAPTAAMVEHTPAPRRIDLNTATAAELMLLPRIGPALAQRIIEHRERRGPYRSIEDLEAVKGIGRRTIERLRPLVTLTLPLSTPDRNVPAAR